MKITDLKGFQIEVTELDKAIKVTERYKMYEYLNEGFSELDKRLNRYCTDMYEKLLKIKAKQNEQPVK